jgi:arginine-tRNA-protein transferase
MNDPLLFCTANEPLLFSEYFQQFYAERVEPEQMDILWADGWRHFGSYFFRNMLDMVGSETTLILPLRVDVQHCVPSKSQRRVLRKNADVRVCFEPVQLSEAHHALFAKHRKRFVDNTPDSLYDFLSDDQASVPCEAYQCCVYAPLSERETIDDTEKQTGLEKQTGKRAEQLIAVSFVDIGSEALSSIYAMFDPKQSWRSLGIFTLLREIAYAQNLGKRYVYLGYAHPPSVHGSPYAYKQQFSATEYYTWSGQWLPLERF